MRYCLVICLLSLAACGQNDGGANPGQRMKTAEASELAVAADADAAVTDAAADAPVPAGTPPVGAIAQIAYAYKMTLELPGKAVIPLRDAHVKACQAAGPQQCQLIGTTSATQGQEWVSAELSLRGAPKWLEGFRAETTASAEKADGQLLSSAISSEDLTRQMIDSDAQLKAKTTLRGRLQDLLANRKGELGELLEVERELARVQGEIDSMTSQLAAMRARVAMSDLTISYQSEGVPVSDQTASPTLDALNDFLGTVSSSFAGVIRLVAALLPWLLILLPLLWGLRRLWRARRVRPH
jgi:vacuolar-type H+-ATPase subunit E/Vma4